MNEKPIERLNYFNGQRLEAEDLRLEQEYHMRIQRWLSKSLFSPGWADGYDVSIDESDRKHVIVKPGLALDDLGRAIVLVAERKLTVQAPYLCVRYAERTAAPQGSGCTVRTGASAKPAASDGPSRIVAEPEFVWRRHYPTNDTREIMIARLDVDDACKVARVAEGPRLTAVAAQVSRVHSYALEGEKDVDSKNPKTIWFHIVGRRPNAVHLVLRGAEISGLHYTELAHHSHELVVTGKNDERTLETTVATTLDAHTHSGESLEVKGGDHTHVIAGRISRVENGHKQVISLIWDGVASPSSWPNLADVVMDFDVAYSKEHDHSIKNNVGPATDGVFTHTHRVTIPATDTAIASSAREEGNAPLKDERKLRKGPQYSYLRDLRVFIDNRDCTTDIIKQIAIARPHIWANVPELGDTQNTHPFVEHGTGLIRLDVLAGVDFSEGEHKIELKVAGDGTGGSVHYNLYVE